MRALTSPTLWPGSIPGPSVSCGLRLLLVPVLAPRVFYSLHKNQIPIRPGNRREEEPSRGMSTAKFDLLLLILLLLLLLSSYLLRKCIRGNEVKVCNLFKC